jgi:hypothetical protein
VVMSPAEALYVHSTRGHSICQAGHRRHTTTGKLREINEKLALCTGYAGFGRVYHGLAKSTTLPAVKRLRSAECLQCQVL